MEDREEFERRVGTTLRGKWTLEKLLGVGGMAAVYVGRHGIGRRDAIKILHAEFAKDKDLRHRFEREAQAANRFKHPGAVEILDMDIADDGAPFLVMELLEGESLAARAERGAMPVDEVLRLVDELLDVLAAAHAQGIVHRDIKPDNLFIEGSGRLKVLDFGIARMRQGAVSSLYTKAGALLGTLSYMPPEQILGEAIDARADLFAVGATMFRLLARRRLHEAASQTDMVVKMATMASPKLGDVA
ncbi:MAG TPA: serine/threonine-protein kinase, partial [Minicystis sp.]|nr:serine/threonine-protein kinase [Minicystis sp.]